MGNRSRIAISLLAATLVVSLVLVTRASISSARQSRGPGTSGWLLYVLDSSRDQLRPLDPSTLQDAAGVPSIRLLPSPSGTQSTPDLVISPNGRWIASIVSSSRSNGRTIGIFDARTGKRRGTTYRISLPIGIDGISNNGGQLYGFRQASNSYTELSLNAATGRVQRQVMVRDGCCGPTLLDAIHHRFYVLMTAGADHPTIDRHAPVLVAYDLALGRMVGRTVLRGILAGTWASNLRENGFKVPAWWSPGIALSPDGSQIAVFDGSNNQLTLIDTRGLRVERRLTVSAPSTALDGILGALGVTPTIAEAKEFQGMQLNLEYSADGTMLYLSGVRGSPSHAQAPFHSLGLRAIDVAGGHFQGSAFPGKQFEWQSSGPQGSEWYGLLPVTANSPFGCPCTLLRLNGATLKTEAQRTGVGALNEAPSLYFLQPRG